MIAGDQQPALGLEQAHVRGGVAGRLDHRPGAEVGLDRHAVDERSVGLDHARDPGRESFGALGVRRQRGLGNAALAPHLQPARERGGGIAGRRGPVCMVRMHPQLAAGALADRRRLSPVVGVRVGAHQQPDVLEPQVDLIERTLELRHRPRLVHPGVDEHDSRPGRDRPGIAVRHSRPWQRQPQPPEAGQHALASAELTPWGHGADDIAAA